jgi:hypothetical protein
MPLPVHLSILPPPQLMLWPDLDQVPNGFVLYGGTALALQLGHRVSVDFDFFTSDPFDPAELRRRIPLLAGGDVLQEEDHTLTVTVETIEGGVPVKLSFFGGLALRVVRPPRLAPNGIPIASLIDIAGTKAKTVQDRIEERDYRDLAVSIEQGMTVDDIIGSCAAIFGAQIDPTITAQTMAWFGEPAMAAWPDTIKRTLTRAVALSRQATLFEPAFDTIAASAASVGR